MVLRTLRVPFNMETILMVIFTVIIVDASVREKPIQLLRTLATAGLIREYQLEDRQSGCYDTPDWDDGFGNSCGTYSDTCNANGACACANGAVIWSYAELNDMHLFELNHPEENCCSCGKIACYHDNQCKRFNADDACSYPGTASAACVTPACVHDSQCDALNAGDACTYPGTASAACVTPACVDDSQCDALNAGYVCSYPGTASAACVSEFWMKEGSDMRCQDYTITSGVSDQIECQTKCEETGACLGISYSYTDAFTSYCIVCKNDVMITVTNGYGFYRKPVQVTTYQYNLYLNTRKSCHAQHVIDEKKKGMTLEKCKGLCDENEDCKYISYPIEPKKVDGKCRLIRSCDDTQKYKFPRITFEKVKVVVKGGCIAWRQTFGCDHNGAKRPSMDKDCLTSITPWFRGIQGGWSPKMSGYCDCKDGSKKMRKARMQHKYGQTGNGRCLMDDLDVMDFTTCNDACDFECKVEKLPGDGTKQGTCGDGMVCTANGACGIDPFQCYGTANGAKDKYHQSCSFYGESLKAVALEHYCGKYDDEDFEAKKMCCECDGGERRRT